MRRPIGIHGNDKRQKHTRSIRDERILTTKQVIRGKKEEN
jgi:hypothetical protein